MPTRQLSLSLFADMAGDFHERLKRAADHAKVEYSQTAIAKELDVSKQTVDQWMAGSLPRAGVIYRMADKWGLNPRWLATGQGSMLGPSDAIVADTSLETHERELLARYRAADPRWQLSLRLLAALAVEDQIEAATDVNMVVARIMGKKPADVRYVSNERVRQAFGDVPQVVRGLVRVKEGTPPPYTATKKKRAVR